MAYKKCNHMEAHPDKDGKVRVREDKLYRCLAPVPSVEELMLPASVTRAYGFTWPPTKTYVDKSICEQCPRNTTKKA